MAPNTGTVKQVIVDVSEQGGIDLEIEAHMMPCVSNLTAI
jgi:hypothetical protein